MVTQVNGMPQSSNATKLDGATISYPWLPRIVAYLPPVEAVEAADVAGLQRVASVRFQPATRSDLRTDGGDVDVCLQPRSRGETPEGCRRDVAEDGTLAGGKKRGRLAGVLGQSLVSEDVYPSMDPMKETTIGASPNATVP